MYHNGMPAKVLSGTALADRILASIRAKVKRFDPMLTIVQVGDDAASTVYIRRKVDACKTVGMRCKHLHLPASTGFASLRQTIRDLNADDDVTGIIVQLPLPPRLNPSMPLLMKELDPKKDVDGLTAYNLGKTLIAKEFEHLPAATPAGIVALLEDANVNVAGKHVVIVGASMIVGKPLAAMLINREATVTVCHKVTKHLADHCKAADILVTAVGKPGLITKSMVKKGAIVIDVGITQTKDGLRGDVDFKTVREVAKAITPVPGGIGPMTVACLLRNVVRAWERQQEARAATD